MFRSNNMSICLNIFFFHSFFKIFIPFVICQRKCMSFCFYFTYRDHTILDCFSISNNHSDGLSNELLWHGRRTKFRIRIRCNRIVSVCVCVCISWYLFNVRENTCNTQIHFVNKKKNEKKKNTLTQYSSHTVWTVDFQRDFGEKILGFFFCSKLFFLNLSSLTHWRLVFEYWFES